MHRLVSDSDITLFSRFECKYLISPLQVPALREFIEPFMRPDSFAARGTNNRYPISSLYLDSDDLMTYHQTVGGEKNRFKLRVRTYSDDPDTEAFFEVKRKINSIVQKRRARLGREEAGKLLDIGGGPRWSGSLTTGGDLDEFLNQVALIGAKPVVRVRYMREAYESRAGDPLRITLDTELMHAVTLDNDLGHASGRWVSTPVDGVILELKFTERFPGWIASLVRMLGLKQQPVPKYVLSIDHMLMHGRESVLSLGGFALPVRRI